MCPATPLRTHSHPHPPLTLLQVGEGRARTAEAYETSQAALESMKRKLDIYKKENKNLLSSYDDWLKTLTKR